MEEFSQILYLDYKKESFLLKCKLQVLTSDNPQI